MSERTIRDKCTYVVCQGIKKQESKAVLEMADTFGEWSHKTGWSGEIYCTTCGRRVEYVGNICESKADVEKKLRFLWHMANETVDNTCEFTPDGMMNRCHDEHGHTHKRDETDFCSRGERRTNDN